MTETAAPDEGFVTIHINKDRTSGPVRGGVNGRTYEVKVGSDETVPIWVARALRDTHIDFSIVAGDLGEDEGGAEGSAPSSSVETHTAIRGEATPLDGVAGTPMASSLLPADPPLLGQVGGAQSGSAGQPGNATGTTQPPEGGQPAAGEEGGDTFAETFINRNLDDISADDIAALTDEQRAAVIAAEKDREAPRKGLLGRLGVSDES